MGLRGNERRKEKIKCLMKSLIIRVIKANETGGACKRCRRSGKWIEGYVRETSMEETLAIPIHSQNVN